MTTEPFQLFYPSERTALFVDGQGTYGATKSLQFDIDYKKLLRVFAGKSTIVRAYYYTVVSSSEDYDPVRPLLDYLSYNGWTVVGKLGREYTDTTGQKKYKGEIIADLVVDAMEIADHVEHVVLFCGDGNLRRLIEALQRRGKRVSVVSTVENDPPTCSDSLRRQADNFIELDGLRGLIEKVVKPVVLERSPSRGACE